jgi:hypothetical protein
MKIVMRFLVVSSEVVGVLVGVKVSGVTGVSGVFGPSVVVGVSDRDGWGLLAVGAPPGAVRGGPSVVVGGRSATLGPPGIVGDSGVGVPTVTALPWLSLGMIGKGMPVPSP